VTGGGIGSFYSVVLVSKTGSKGALRARAPNNVPVSFIFYNAEKKRRRPKMWLGELPIFAAGRGSLLAESVRDIS
jgi:hypothetical protein